LIKRIAIERGFKKMKGLKVLLVVLIVQFVVGCGGGGGSSSGSSGGSSSSGSAGKLKRGTSTGIRVVQASIDTAPVSVRVAGNVVQTARFVQTSYYAGVPAGPVVLRLEQANRPDALIAEIPTTLAENTEYTVFVSGTSTQGQFNARLVEDLSVRPPVGKAMFRAYHAFSGGPSLIVNANGVDSDFIRLGDASSFKEIPSGPTTVIIKNSGGPEISRLTIDVPDQGEISVVVAGQASIGAYFTPVYIDLD
jgi:hypothetical protein